MLVGYSSSSEEEVGDAGNEAVVPRKRKRHPNTNEVENEVRYDYLAKKEIRTEGEIHKERLPVPDCLLDMFPEKVDPQTEDSTLHGGRIRSFQHERGNWATYVYFAYNPDEEFMELLEDLLSTAGARGVPLFQQEEFHLSLSKTVVLRHHWIQPLTWSLKSSLAHCKKFVCSARRLKVYCNAEKTRTFLGMEVSSGHVQLLDLVKVIDKTMTEFRLDTFYKEPSFHVSLAWCVGDLTEQINHCLQELQSLVDEHEEGPFLLMLDFQELHCKAGNKTFSFPLES